VPLPNEPQLSSPGFALASAMNSCTDVTGNDDGTIITGVIWPSIRIAVRSFCES